MQPVGAGRNRIGSKVERPLSTLDGLMWGKVVFPTSVLNHPHNDGGPHFHTVHE